MALLRRPAAAPPRYLPLRVAEVEPVAEHAVSLSFDVSGPEHAAYLSYVAGQYVTLDAVIDGDRVRQSYSLWTRPAVARAEGRLRIAVAQVSGGRMSPWLVSSVRAGDDLRVLPPMGEFTYAPVAGAARHGVVAGGSGITPVLAIMAEILAADPGTEVDVVLANRARGSSVLRERLAQMEAVHAGRLRVVDVLSREPAAGARFGHVDPALLDEVFGTRPREGWWLCGPEGLLVLCEDWLTAREVPLDRVHRERFTSTGPVDPRPAGPRPAGPVQAERQRS